jgi:hypothetical protein
VAVSCSPNTVIVIYGYMVSTDDLTGLAAAPGSAPTILGGVPSAASPADDIAAESPMAEMPSVAPEAAAGPGPVAATPEASSGGVAAGGSPTSQAPGTVQTAAGTKAYDLGSALFAAATLTVCSVLL